MIKLKNWKDLKREGIYNRIYIGPNEDYSRINGKETFMIVETEPKLQVAVLFDQFGDPHTENIESNVITFHSPEIAFREFELFEPANEGEWFKKSVKVTSLRDTLQFNVTMADIERVAKWQCRSPFMPTFDVEWKMKGVQCSFRVEDKTTNPFLQTVFIVWPSWKAMAADFEGFGFTART